MEYNSKEKISNEKIQKNVEEFLKSNEYINYCNNIVQNSLNSQKSLNPLTTISLTKNFGYIVNNVEKKVDMTPPLSSNINDIIDYEGST